MQVTAEEYLMPGDILDVLRVEEGIVALVIDAAPGASVECLRPVELAPSRWAALVEVRLPTDEALDVDATAIGWHALAEGETRVQAMLALKARVLDVLFEQSLARTRSTRVSWVPEGRRIRDRFPRTAS